MSQIVIVDFEGFKLPNCKYIIKEFAYVNTNTGESMCYFFQSPKHFTQTQSQIINVIHWLTKHFHKIDFNYGILNIKHLNTILNSISNKAETTFLIKGEEKCKYISDLTGRKFNNLENYGCPKFEHLSYPTIFCGLDKHYNNTHCALKKAKSYSIWYNE